MLTAPFSAQCPACVVTDLLGITAARWRSRRPGQSASAGQSSPITCSSTQTVAWGTTTTAGTQMGEPHPGASTGSHQGPSAGPTATVTKVRAAARPCQRLGCTVSGARPGTCAAQTWKQQVGSPVKEAQHSNCPQLSK